MTTNNNLTRLKQYENRWTTDLGAWFPGERVVFRGKDLFQDLERLDWMGLWLYGITGRVPTPKQIQLFSGIWVISTSFPDPRLWNNRIGALAGTARSTVALGLSAGTAVSEAIVYGQRPLITSMDFITRTHRKITLGEKLDDILLETLNIPHSNRSGSGPNRKVAKIPGYGRPITSRDERIAPLMRLAKRLDLQGGPHVRLAFAIEAGLQAKGYDLRMNIAALMGALCADQGLAPREYYHYTTLCFSAGILTCAIDAQQKPEGMFFPLRCENIKYSGPAHRRWEAQNSNEHPK